MQETKILQIHWQSRTWEATTVICYALTSGQVTKKEKTPKKKKKKTFFECVSEKNQNRKYL